MQVTTIAGGYRAGFADGQGLAASFSQPNGVTVDLHGNFIIADTENHRIRKIASDGTVTTFAGSGTDGFADGPSATACFSYPHDVAVDVDGNVIVADTFNHRIRRVAPDGRVTTVAGDGVADFLDGPGLEAHFNLPTGVAVDLSGIVFVGDSWNHRIRQVAVDGSVTTLAGSGIAIYRDGAGQAAGFNEPWGIAVDIDNNVLVADCENHLVRKVTRDGSVSTLVGIQAANLQRPTYLAATADGRVVVGDQGSSTVRLVADGEVTTIAGSGDYSSADGLGTGASFKSPSGIAVSNDGCVIVAEVQGHKIRRVEAQLPALQMRRKPKALQLTAQQDAGGSVTVRCISMAGDELDRIASLDSMQPLSSLAALINERIPPPPGVRWQLVLPNAECPGESKMESTLADLFGFSPGEGKQAGQGSHADGQEVGMPEQGERVDQETAAAAPAETHSLTVFELLARTACNSISKAEWSLSFDKMAESGGAISRKMFAVVSGTPELFDLVKSACSSPADGQRMQATRSNTEPNLTKGQWMQAFDTLDTNRSESLDRRDLLTLYRVRGISHLLDFLGGPQVSDGALLAAVEFLSEVGATTANDVFEMNDVNRRQFLSTLGLSAALKERLYQKLKLF